MRYCLHESKIKFTLQDDARFDKNGRAKRNEEIESNIISSRQREKEKERKRNEYVCIDVQLDNFNLR